MATDRPGAVWTQHKPTIAVPRSLWAAAKANDVGQLARLLDEGCAIDERDYRGYSPLMLAGYCGNLDAVDLLLQQRAVDGDRQPREQTPFIVREVTSDLQVLPDRLANLHRSIIA